MTNASSTAQSSQPNPLSNKTGEPMPQDWFRAALNIGLAPLQVVAPFLTQVPGVTDIGTRSDQSPSQFTPPDFTFAIWGLIFLGMLAFAVYQALPRNLANPLLRRVGWWAAAAMALNAAWELHVVAAGITLLSVAIIVAMGAALLTAFAIVSRTAPLTTIEKTVVVAPISLFAGWITVASLASTLTWGLNAGGFSTGALTEGTVGAILALIGGCVGATVIWANRGNAVYLAVFVWAFGGIAYKSAGLNEPLTMAGAFAAIAIPVAAYLAVVYDRRKRLSNPSLP
jgi:translocator protein